MKAYSLSYQYAIAGLDGLDSLHMSTAKRAVLRAIKAAGVLEQLCLDQEPGEDFAEKLKNGLVKVKKQSGKEAKKLEQEIAAALTADGVLEEAPDLLGCDMYYQTAGVTMKVYRSDKEIYLQITEQLRAEFLEEGPVTREAVCMLWLFRESSCIHEIFSAQEQERIEQQMVALSAEDPLCRAIWQAEFHDGLERTVSSFLKSKRKLFKNPFLEGVNLMYPFLDRRQAIFIDFVVLGTNVGSRRTAIVCYLTEHGHYVEEVKSGTETLLKIDNSYYRIFPRTVSCSKIPIQGAQLLPVYR